MPKLPEYYVYTGLLVSAIIAVTITYVFRGIAENNAEQIMSEAESI